MDIKKSYDFNNLSVFLLVSHTQIIWLNCSGVGIILLFKREKNNRFMILGISIFYIDQKSKKFKKITLNLFFFVKV